MSLFSYVVSGVKCRKILIKFDIQKKRKIFLLYHQAKITSRTHGINTCNPFSKEDPGKSPISLSDESEKNFKKVK